MCGHRLLFVLALSLGLAGASGVAAEVPLLTPVQGALLDNAGAPVVAGAFAMDFALYSGAEGGEAVWEESWPEVVVSGGVFHVLLGSQVPLTPEIFAPGALWLGMRVEGEPELERRPLGTAPYASYAAMAAGLDCSGCVGPEHVSSVGEDALPAAGLDEVSNGLLTNERTESWAAAGAVAIADDFPPGVTSDLTVPGTTGLVRALRVHVSLVNSDIGTITLSITDPDGATHVLWDQDGGGTAIEGTWPEPDPVISGDLLGWVGRDPAGTWTLHVVDDGFLNNEQDGEVTSWSVEIESLVSDELVVTSRAVVEGDLIVDGRVQIGQAPPACDASRAGSIHFDPAQQRLVFCDGVNLLQLKACDISCPSADTFECETAVINGCGDSCGATGSAISPLQCLSKVATTACGVQVVDNCGNDCAQTGSALDVGGCPAAEDVPCGSTVADVCGNVCGYTGIAPDAGSCPLPTLVGCGDPVIDDCGNDCGTAGTSCPAGFACEAAGCIGPGASASNPALSCQDVVDAGASIGDGLYWLDFDGGGGNGALQAFCEMSIPDEGWLRVDIDFLRLHADLTTQTTAGSESHGFVDGNTKFYGYPDSHDHEVWNDFDLGMDYTQIRGSAQFTASSGSVGGWNTSGTNPDNQDYGIQVDTTYATLTVTGSGGNKSWHRWGKPGQVFHAYDQLGWTGEWYDTKTLNFGTIDCVAGSVLRFSTFSESGAAGLERWAFNPTVFVR